MSVTVIPPELRTAVIMRDGWHCLSCGVRCNRWPGAQQPDSLHIDHVIPECKGGPTTLLNLQVLCRGCNLRKGKRCIDYRRVTTLVPNPEPPLVDQIAAAHAAIDQRTADRIAAIRATPAFPVPTERERRIMERRVAIPADVPRDLHDLMMWFGGGS